MHQMFNTAALFNGDTSDWDTALVTDMSYMFAAAHSFDSNLSAWNTSRVRTMESMFDDATSFAGDVSSWDTSRVVTMKQMFRFASSFNGEIAVWDISSVQDMTEMFNHASFFNQNLCAWGDVFPYVNEDDMPDNDEYYAAVGYYVWLRGDIFYGSGCTFQEIPQMIQKGPFCSSSCSTFNSTDLSSSNGEGVYCSSFAGRKDCVKSEVCEWIGTCVYKHI